MVVYKGPAPNPNPGAFSGSQNWPKNQLCLAKVPKKSFLKLALVPGAPGNGEHFPLKMRKRR